MTNQLQRIPIVMSRCETIAFSQGLKKRYRVPMHPQPRRDITVVDVYRDGTVEMGRPESPNIALGSMTVGSCPMRQGTRFALLEPWRNAGACIEYQFDTEEGFDSGQWNRAESMPLDLSRSFGTVQMVEAQPLQSITNNEARLEGMPNAAPHRHGTEGLDFDGRPPDRYRQNHNTGINDCWICSYKLFLGTTRSPRLWWENPWVFVYHIELDVAPTEGTRRRAKKKEKCS